MHDDVCPMLYPLKFKTCKKVWKKMKQTDAHHLRHWDRCTRTCGGGQSTRHRQATDSTKRIKKNLVKIVTEMAQQFNSQQKRSKEKQLYDIVWHGSKKSIVSVWRVFFVWFRWLEIPDLEARQQRHGHSRKNGPPCLNEVLTFLWNQYIMLHHFTIYH